MKKYEKIKPQKILITTVDEGNPAPVDGWFLPLFIGFNHPFGDAGFLPSTVGYHKDQLLGWGDDHYYSPIGSSWYSEYNHDLSWYSCIYIYMHTHTHVCT